jgi:hypothetical protein
MLFTRGKRQLGYGIIIDPGAADEEVDSLTCGHCNMVVWMKPFQDGEAMGGRCTCCDKYICLGCVEKYRAEGCITLEQQLERWERRKDYG